MFSSTLGQDDILRQLDEAFPSELIHKLEHEVKAIASAPTSSLLHDPIIHDVLKFQRRNLPLLVEKARSKKKDRVSIKELSLRLNKYLLYIVDPVLLDESRMHYEQALKELMSETPHTKKGSKKYPKDYISQILMDNYELFLKVSTLYFNLSFSSIVTRYLVSIIYKLECWEIYHLLHVIPELEYMLNLLEFEVKHTSFGYIVKPPANFLDFNLRQGLQYPFPYPFYNFSYHSLDPRAGSRKMKRISVKPYIDLRLDRDKRGVSKDTPASKDDPVRDCALDVQEYTDTDYSSDDSDDFRRWKIVYMFIEMSPDEIYQDFDLCFPTSVKREYEDEEYDSDHARLIDERERAEAGLSIDALADVSVSLINQADPSNVLPKGGNALVDMTQIPSSLKATDPYTDIDIRANTNTNSITNNPAVLDASRQPEIIVLDPPEQPEIIVLDPPEQPEIIVLNPPQQPEITHTPAVLDPPQELKIVPSVFQKAFAQAFDDGLVRNTLLHQCKLVDPVLHKTCMKVFYGKNELTRHQEFVHATCKRLYRCAYCQDDPNEEKIKAYPRYDSLSRHIRRKHGIVGQDNKIAISLARKLAESDDTVVASDPLTDLGSGGRPEAWVTLESNTGISRSAISLPLKKRRKSSSRPPWADPVDEERKPDEFLRILSPDLDPVKSTLRSVPAKSVSVEFTPVESAHVKSTHVKSTSVKSTPTLIPSGVLPTSAFPSVVAPRTSATSTATSPKSNAFKHSIVSGNVTQNLFWANGRSGVFSTPQNRAAQVQGLEIQESKIQVQVQVQGPQGPQNPQMQQQTAQIPGQVKVPRAQGIYRQTQPFHPYKPHGQLPQAYSMATNEDSKTKHTRVLEHPVASGSHQNIGEGLRGQFGIPRNDFQYYPYTKPAYPYLYPPQVPDQQTQIQGSMSEQSQNLMQNSLHTSHEVFQSDMGKNPNSAQSNYISSPSGQSGQLGQSEGPSERQD